MSLITRVYCLLYVRFVGELIILLVFAKYSFRYENVLVESKASNVTVNRIGRCDKKNNRKTPCVT